MKAVLEAKSPKYQQLVMSSRETNFNAKKQTSKYRESIIPKSSETFVIELSSSYSWYKYTNDDSHLFTIDHFGESGSKDLLLKKYKFDAEIIADKIEKLLK